MMEIARGNNWGYKTVVYWMQKHQISRRSQSEATYVKRNIHGDPFRVKFFEGQEDLKLFHLGIGLYLGEGDKRNKGHVKLANTDPKILKIFLMFLRDICGVRESKIKAELNVFDDVDVNKAIDFWLKSTGITRNQLRNIQVREGKRGSYKHKSQYGTLSIYVCNTKLKKIINQWCREALV